MASQAQLQSAIDAATAQLRALEAERDALLAIGDVQQAKSLYPQIEAATQAVDEATKAYNLELVTTDYITPPTSASPATGQSQPQTVTGDPGVQRVNPETGELYSTGQRVNPETGELYYPVPAEDPSAGNTNRGLSGAIKNTRAQATLQDTTNFNQRKDWRVRLALSPGAQQAKYLYYSDTPGILAPLQGTDGVIFPYTPSINVTYGATYNSVIPAHSNYKIFQYESSSVDSITITCDFTAQDTAEANYVLAVIHFFRSVTKMFYGQDEFPKPGTPPPLCYLFGLGEFQFNAHPLAITNFTYNLPTDVDYIRAGAVTDAPGQNRSPSGSPQKPKKTNPFQAVAERLAQNAVSKLGGTAQTILKKVIPGGKLAGPTFNGSQNGASFNSVLPTGTKDPTYVPTKINISISAVPIVSRYDISNRFSVKDYASGKLLNGTKQAGGGIW